MTKHMHHARGCTQAPQQYEARQCFSMLDLASRQVTSISMIFSRTTCTDLIRQASPCPTPDHVGTEGSLRAALLRLGNYICPQVPACSTNMEARPVNTNSPWSHCHTPSEHWALGALAPNAPELQGQDQQPHSGLCSRQCDVSLPFMQLPGVGMPHTRPTVWRTWVLDSAMLFG